MRNRPETGPMQFGDDWRGFFIRGDSAMGYIMDLEHVLALDGDRLCSASKSKIQNLINELRESHHHSSATVQQMATFRESFIEDIEVDIQNPYG